MEKTILAIESSCDETAAAVVRGTEVLSSVVASQIDLHALTGGVVPEVAARAHLQQILAVIDKALLGYKICHLDRIRKSADEWRDLKERDPSTRLLNSNRLGMTRPKDLIKYIDYIAVTQFPGLIGSLLVGVETANALGLAFSKPVVPINHYSGHLFSFLPAVKKVAWPVLTLTVSGGHTSLYFLKSLNNYIKVGSTRDDAAGEAFDKGAAILGLSYPGGPAIEKVALGGDPNKYKLPRPMLREPGFDFSFSGLKTALIKLKEDIGSAAKVEDLAASLQEAIADSLAGITKKALLYYKPKALALVGGVASNSRVQGKIEEVAQTQNIEFYLAPKGLRTDNAAMIGIAAAMTIKDNEVNRDTFKEASARVNI